jgi:hypothetical protein
MEGRAAGCVGDLSEPRPTGSPRIASGWQTQRQNAMVFKSGLAMSGASVAC